MLAEVQVESFIRDGFLVLRNVVPPSTVEVCRRLIGEELSGLGVNLDDPSTWTDPVARVYCPYSEGTAAAARQPALFEAYDQLLGVGRWVEPQWLGGSVAARFPSETDPGDAGWHIDGSFDVEGEYWVNLSSRGRGLLCLFLLTDVGPLDAPTELKVGSHLDVPALLAPHGDGGIPFHGVSTVLGSTTLERPSAFATGLAGDVFVCHPFLVHRATWPHDGVTPRIIAQPEVGLIEPLPLDGRDPSVVEQAILMGLASDGTPDG